MPGVNGKSGTITPEEFETLSGMVEKYGAKLLSSKVAKICNKIAEPYSHEFAGSSVASAWKGLAAKITGSVGTGTAPVTTSTFGFLTDLVSSYGAEVVVLKIAKIAKRSGNNTDAATLKALFPKAA